MVTTQPLGFLLGLRTYRNKLGSSQSRQGAVVKENNLKLSQLIIKQDEGCTTRLLTFKKSSPRSVTFNPLGLFSKAQFRTKHEIHCSLNYKVPPLLLTLLGVD